MFLGLFPEPSSSVSFDSAMSCVHELIADNLVDSRRIDDIIDLLITAAPVVQLLCSKQLSRANKAGFLNRQLSKLNSAPL
jgi:hypothetical protein